MRNYKREAAEVGAAADEELAFARVQINELLAANGQLELDLLAQQDLLLTLSRSQATRGKALKRAREREAELLAQLHAAGVAVEGERPRESFFKTKATKHP